MLNEIPWSSISEAITFTLGLWRCASIHGEDYAVLHNKEISGIPIPDHQK